MKHLAVNILLIVLFMSQCFAQKFINHEIYNVDSLLLILPDQIEEERVNSLNKLAISLTLLGEDSDIIVQYAEEALNLAKELNYQEGIATAYRNLGYINFYHGNYPDALNSHFEALRIYEKLDKKNIVATLYYDIAAGHYYARNYEKAIEYGYIALDKYSERQEGGATVGSVRDTLNAMGGLGLAYYTLGMFDKSVEITLEFIEVAKKNNFGITEVMLHTFLAGKRFYLAGKTDSAKVYLEKALAFPDVNPNVQALKYRPLTWLGYLHYEAGDFDTAVFHLTTAFEWYKKNGFLYWAIFVANDLGNIYFEKNELNSAEKYYGQSEKIFYEMLDKNSWYRHDSLKYIVSYGPELYSPISPKHMKEMMWTQGRSMYFRLYQINEAKKRTEKALKYHISFSMAKDTLNKLQRNRETIEMQTKYETERKEGQIEFLSQENVFQEFKLKQSRYFSFGLGGLVILVVILAIVLIRQNKLREQQKNLLLQQKLFRSQMNPHFIFNSLTSIQNYILDEEAHKASKYLSRFSKLVRNILDSSIEDFVPLEEEISTIENYLELQKIRFKDKFDYSIEVDEAINPESMNIPPMLAQPFIENSIEHGIKHKKSKGNIFIRFTLKKNMIVFEVEDDGVGREKAKEILYKQNKEHKSLATAITRERIQVLNKKLKEKIDLYIEDLIGENKKPLGTLVAFEIPYKQS